MNVQPRHLLIAFIAVVALVYAPGLGGPFLFDDGPNFALIERWLAGQATLSDALFGTRSGVLGRPVAMAGFTLNAWLTGVSPAAFKLVNVLVHIGIGMLLWLTARRLLRRDPRVADWADWLGALAAALWLLHPLHVSTVLYAVQRMAQLSALFSLAAVLAYVHGREQLERGAVAQALRWLYLAVPGLFVLGLLCKENAAVAPLLCLVVELTLFSRDRRPRWITGFFAVSLVLPAIAVLVALGTEPDRLLAGYAQRDFTLIERLLSQSRALADYLGQFFFPRPALMGLYADDFAPSRGLLSPPSTLIALLGLALVSVAAVWWRRRQPWFFFGWFFFLAGHAVESTILPLELYFEHRNYLPSMGVAISVVAILGGALRQRRSRPAFLAGAAGASVVLIVLALGTVSQALAWRSLDTLARQGATAHPGSLRANLDAATVALQTGDYASSTAAMQRLIATTSPRNRLIGQLGMATIQCLETGAADPERLSLAVETAPRRVSLAEYQAFGLLLRAREHSRCRGVEGRSVADAIDAVLDGTREQPDGSAPKWRLRMVAAQAYLADGDAGAALEQARLAWQPGADAGVGTVLVQAAAAAGEFPEAEWTLDEMSRRAGRSPIEAQAIDALRQQLETLKGQASNGP